MYSAGEWENLVPPWMHGNPPRYHRSIKLAYRYSVPSVRRKAESGGALIREIEIAKGEEQRSVSGISQVAGDVIQPRLLQTQ